MSKNKHLCYLFTKKHRLTCKTTLLNSSIDLNHVFNFAKSGQFVKMNYGVGSDGVNRQYDDEIRDSEISSNMFDLGELTIEDTNSDFNITIDHMFEFLKYNKGGHFEEHEDRKRYIGHSHTICIYPPQNVEGGELIVNKKTTIPMSKDSWTVVIFPIDTLHTSNSVKSGTKYVFKGTISIKYHNVQKIIVAPLTQKLIKTKSTRKD